MTWMIEWVFALLLTSVSGSILYLVWYFLGKELEKLGFVSVVFEFLKVVQFFFFFPLGYMALKAMEQELGKGYLFTPTPIVYKASMILYGIWLVGFLIMVIRLGRNAWRNRKVRRSTFACERAVVQQFEAQYYSLTGKKGKLEVVQSYCCGIPCVTGLLQPKLILPVEKYSPEKLEIIFTHEITHYMQRDVLLKWVCAWMLCLHYFNPLAWRFYGAIQKWSEFSDDYRSCRIIGSKKKYFEVITDIAVENAWSVCLSSQLVETKNELRERIEKMKKNSKVKYHSKWLAVLLSMIAFFTSTITVGAATLGSAQMYVDLYHSTEVEIEEVIDESKVPEYVEYIEYGNAEGIVERVGGTNSLTRNINGFEWAVDGNELVMTDSFYCAIGQGIDIMAYMEPEDVEVKVGIIQPDGSKRYVMGADSVDYEFSVMISGNYRVFVENNSGVLVQVEGAYMAY